MYSKTYRFIWLLAVLLIVNVLNAPVLNPLVPAGIMDGFCHGLTLFLNLGGLAVKDNVALYAADNTGFGYVLGYFLGVRIVEGVVNA